LLLVNGPFWGHENDIKKYYNFEVLKTTKQEELSKNYLLK
jgi:hypothetical protein